MTAAPATGVSLDELQTGDPDQDQRKEPSRSGEALSPSATMPAIATPSAPMPTQTA